MHGGHIVLYCLPTFIRRNSFRSCLSVGGQSDSSMDQSADMDATGRSRHNSIIKSANRNKDVQKNRVSFHTHREVQKFNSREERIEVTQERMTPTKSSFSDSPSQSMSASIVTEMVSNVSLADESFASFNEPQAVSTPLCMTRARPPTPAAHRSSAISLRETAISDTGSGTTMKLFQYIKRYNDRHASFAEEFMQEQKNDKDDDHTITAFIEDNSNDVTTDADGEIKADTQSFINSVSAAPNEHAPAMTENTFHEWAIADLKPKTELTNAAGSSTRRYVTPTSTPRSRPANQRKPPRRTIDQTWLVDCENDNDTLPLLLDMDIEASISNAISLGSTTPEENAVANRTPSEVTAAGTPPDAIVAEQPIDSASNSPCLMKKKIQNPTATMDSSPYPHVSLERNMPATASNDPYRSLCAIDASLMDSLMRLIKPRESRGFSPMPLADSPLNCSFRVSNEEEFNATVLDDKVIADDWKLLKAAHQRKERLFEFMETIMVQRAQLTEMEARLNEDLSQSFHTLLAKITMMN